LDLGDRDDDGDVLQALTAACPLPRLKHLELGSTWIRDDVLLVLALACPQLQSLGLNSCRIHEETVAQVAEVCPSLTSLDFDDVVDDMVLCRVAAACPLMRQLSLGPCERVSDVGLRSLAAHCHDLRAINFWCGDITDAGIAALVRGCPLLQCVDIDCCQRAEMTTGNDMYSTNLLLDGRWQWV
jgi:hypothetical protein